MRWPLQLWAVLFAQATNKATEKVSESPGTGDWLPPAFWPGVFMSVVYGVVGIALAVLGFKVFDWITPRMNIQLELSEKHNIAVAIVIGAIIIGVCYIVATAIK
jgi:putative membrane protein